MEIQTKSRDGVCRLELNRPHRKNALTATMYRELVEALAACSTLELPQ